MYTEAETKALKKYPETSVEELAKETGKTTRSVIAKLAKMGLYRKEKTTKTGDPIISKLELVAMIEDKFGPLPTLVKAGKQDLQRLVAQL